MSPMGFLSRMFGRTSGAAANTTEPVSAATAETEVEADPGIDPALASALDALQAGQHEQAFALASQQLQAGADAYRLCALSLGALGRYPQAFDYWLPLFEHEQTAHNALQLATVSVMCGEIDRGEAWLTKFDQINEETREVSPALARSNFISALEQAGHAERALPHLQWLREVYAQLSITDSHFLYVRGLPFFETFLERSLPLLRTQLPAEAIASWYQSIRERLDEPGQATLDAHVAALHP
jgi:tetratricopeptide (TPR) repeat protein